MISKKCAGLVAVVVAATVCASSCLGAGWGERRPGGDRFREPYHRHIIVRTSPHHVGEPVFVRPGPVEVRHEPVVVEHRHPFLFGSVIIFPPRVILGGPTVTVPPKPSQKVEVWITNSNGSKTLVVLVKDGSGYRGPKGEWYSAMPTESQLQVIYGLGNEQTNVTFWITNDNGSRSPITLVREKGGYVGPRGEFYESMPTEEQLKALYGIGGQNVKPGSVVVFIDNADGTKTPIVLEKQGGKYIGPKGEQYDSIPSREQLQMVYATTTKAAPVEYQTIWLTTKQGVRIPVTLVKEGDFYVGPMGESYDELPTAEQLNAIYGDSSAEGTELSLTVVGEDGREIPITLKTQKGKYIGPDGHVFNTMPSADELLERYGNQQTGAKAADTGTVTVMVTNADGTKAAVKLTKQGDYYVGPKGEYYTEKPTEAQLKPVYGK